jgi:tetratricopeptide (TPR) repeat protein
MPVASIISLAVIQVLKGFAMGGSQKMKREKVTSCAVLCAIILALSSIVAWGQGYTGAIKGKVTKNYEPAANVQVVITDMGTGKAYKTKTDKKGEFYVGGLQPGQNFIVEIMGSNKEVLYSKPGLNIGGNITVPAGDIELTKPEASGGTAGGEPFSATPTKKKKPTKEEEAQQKADADKVKNLNTLIQQAQAAMQAQNWADAEKALKQLIEADPNTTRWEFYKALGDSQRAQQHLPDAIQSYEKGVQVALALASGTAPKDPHNPNPDPIKAKAGAGQMLNSEGGAYVELNKNDEAIAAFKRGAEIDPNPSIAYYNLCAMEFNAAKYDDAAAACDKSVAADPSKADAWFFKGAALNKAGKGPAAAEALNKYLQLDPNGMHAAQAKQMLASK